MELQKALAAFMQISHEDTEDTLCVSCPECRVRPKLTSVLVQKTKKTEMRQNPRLRRPQHMQEGENLAQDSAFQVRERQC